MSKDNLERWYAFVRDHDEKALSDMLHDDCVFHSPILHTPQEGKALTYMYLSAAGKVLTEGGQFAYVGEWLSEDGAVIEFNTVIDGIKIDGIDMITWDADGRITDFKVMLRPMKAIEKVRDQMFAMLQQMQKAG
jgi:ketosteroid isomerase-like protein